MRRLTLSVLVFATVFINRQAWSQCPSVVANPVLSATPVEGVRDLSGTGSPLPAGCSATITISNQAPAQSVIGSATVGSDGRFSVHLNPPLTAGGQIQVTETLAPSELKAHSNPMSVATCSDELKIIALPQISGMLLPGERTVTGTAGPPTLAGCTAQVHILQGADPQARVDIPIIGDRSVNSTTGAFSVQLAAPLVSGDSVIVREDFITAAGSISATPMTSVPLTVQDCSANVVGGIRPTLTGSLLGGATSISGQAAQPTLSGCSARVRAWRYELSNTPTLLGTSDAVSGGNFTIAALTDSLVAGQRIALQIVFPDATGIITEPVASCNPLSVQTNCFNVHDSSGWGRVKMYFTGGLLLSQDQGTFSQSNLFMAFTIDKTWRLPFYYYGTHRLAPGISTFFETRLTAIPVSSCTTQASAATTTAGGGTPSSATSTSDSSQSQCAQSSQAAGGNASNFDTFLASRKTARLAVGSYYPWIMSHWAYRGTPNALFIAPLAKVGFDTPVGDVSQTQPTNANATAGSAVTPVNSANFYNFYGYGARIGHYSLTSERSEAPELLSYLDVTFGPFSNLETLGTPNGKTGTDFRKRIYRLSMEGILKVPNTPLVLGFSANVGQEAVGVDKFNISRRAGDDLRFLFGARFDVKKLVDKLIQAAP